MHYLQAVSSPPETEPKHRLAPNLKLHHNPELGFATQDLQAVRAQDELGYRVKPNFLGLCGANAPIPDYLNQELATLAEPSTVAHDYLDLFHHRFYEQLYFGVTEGDVAYQLTQDSQHPWKQRIACLLGLDESARSALDNLSLPSLFAIAPCLMHSDPSKEILEEALNLVLQTLFSGPCEAPTLSIEDFIGRETTLHSAFHNALGTKNSRLGVNCVLGTIVQDPSHEVCVVIEAKSSEQLHQLSPKGSAHQALSTILELTLAIPLKVSFKLCFEDESQSHCCLDQAILGQGAQVSQVDPNPKAPAGPAGQGGQSSSVARRTWVFSQHRAPRQEIETERGFTPSLAQKAIFDWKKASHPD